MGITSKVVAAVIATAALGVGLARAETNPAPIVVPAAGLVSSSGLFGPGFACDTSLGGGTCTDVLTFDLSAFAAAPAVEMAFDVRSVVFGSLVAVPGLQAALVDPALTTIAGAAGDPISFTALVSPTSAFPDGFHRLLVVGLTEGAGSLSSYSVGLNVTAVPEPQAYAMILTGIGLIGWQLRRRSRIAARSRRELSTLPA
jgi:hypothetical protein